MFARRYRGIPSSRLSFNLMNEPGKVDEKAYVAVVRKLAEAIRGEDPQRLIIADGLEWGQVPVPAWAKSTSPRPRAATRPWRSAITRQAGSTAKFSHPAVAAIAAFNGTLLGPAKPEGSQPLVIDGPFTRATGLRLHVLIVSTAARLVVEGDGKTIFDKQFNCGPGSGEWKKAVYQPQWQTYQNLFDRDYSCVIPAGTRQVRCAWPGAIGSRSARSASSRRMEAARLSSS